MNRLVDGALRPKERPAQGRLTRYINARVFGSSRTSLVVQGGRFVPGGPQDECVDLGGAFVVPRLADGHGHLLALGHTLCAADLRGAQSVADVVARMRAHLRSSERLDGGEWLEGFGWDQGRLGIVGFPQHGPLSEAFPNRPVALTRVDGHALWTNAAAMRRAGLGPATETPPGGRIERFSDGRPAGVWVDNAMALVTRHLPAPTTAVRKTWLKRAFQAVLAAGMTGVHDMGMDRETIAAMRALDASGELPIRVHAYTDGLFPALGPVVGRRFRVVGVKLFADGALGSRGAALSAPYSDCPGHCGLLIYPPAELSRRAVAASLAGYPVAIHAIGDRAATVAMDALAAASTARTHPDLPGRLEHAQLLQASQLARLARLGCVVSMQPTHATSDMGWLGGRLGPARLCRASVWRSVVAAGIPLVFGSDFPIESPDVRLGLFAATTRQDVGGRPLGGWFPEQRLSVHEALTAFSLGPALAVGDAAEALADFTVFERDLTQCPGEALLDCAVTRVIVGGDTVWSA